MADRRGGWPAGDLDIGEAGAGFIDGGIGCVGAAGVKRGVADSESAVACQLIDAGRGCRPGIEVRGRRVGDESVPVRTRPSVASCCQRVRTAMFAEGHGWRERLATHLPARTYG